MQRQRTAALRSVGGGQGGGGGGEAGGQLTARAKLDASSRRLLARAAALALGCPSASGSAARGAAQDLMQRGGAPGSQCVGGLSGALGLAPWPALTLFEATLPRSACCTELGTCGNLPEILGPRKCRCTRLQLAYYHHWFSLLLAYNLDMTTHYKLG